MKIIDLRSDTVTKPTPAMLEAMSNAELGDDVFGEDPTTNRLEDVAALRMGKEAALFVPSGTMGNLISMLTHCDRGEEVILGDRSHIFLNEAGGISGIGGIHPHIVPNQPDGTMVLEDLESAIRGDNIHFPRTRLICLESTHNRCSGSPLALKYIKSIADLAQQNHLQIHLDGARIFNAAIALGIDVEEITHHMDSVIFCLSKGLAAPIGSLVCGPGDFIAEARRIRKSLGGGMRQTGVIAAAGLVALEEMVDRLADDHENARILAQGIEQIAGLEIDDESRVRTNILYFDLDKDRMDPEEFIIRLEGKGVRILRTGPARFRMVTHYGIEREDIEIALGGLEEVMKKS